MIPQPDEYAPFYAGYVQRVPAGSDILALLNQQPDELTALLRSLPETPAALRPTSGA